MKSSPITYQDRVTLRPLNLLQVLHEPNLTIRVVPNHEKDADKGLISADSPLGRAVLRRTVGDTITIEVQGHSLSMLILAVEKSRVFA